MPFVYKDISVHFVPALPLITELFMAKMSPHLFWGHSNDLPLNTILTLFLGHCTAPSSGHQPYLTLPPGHCTAPLPGLQSPGSSGRNIEISPHPP